VTEEKTAGYSVTGIGYCQHAKELLDTFAQAVRELIKLHEDQFQALVGGDPDSQRFDDLIHMANDRKRKAKYAYIHHLETHGCSTEHGTDQN
jgi:hypothetical protein